MIVKMELTFDELKEQCWAGALDTLKWIEEQGLEEEAESLLEECFSDGESTMIQLNDFIWFTLADLLEEEE